MNSADLALFDFYFLECKKLGGETEKVLKGTDKEVDLIKTHYKHVGHSQYIF